MSRPRIAIVGGGFTGATLAVHLGRVSAQPLAIDIFEPRETLGAGLAYGSCGIEHRINVPSDRMVVFAEDPLHFTRWLKRSGAAAADPDGLTPSGEHYPRRQAFAAYMADLMRQTAEDNPSASLIRHRRAAVVDLREDRRGVDVVADDGAEAVDHAVVCISHAAPAFRWPVSAAAADLPHLLRDPWQPELLTAIPKQAAVFIVGTGLTMADVVVSLRGQSHRGTIHAVSRRALTPRPHAAFDDTFAFFGSHARPATALALLRHVRQRTKEAERLGLTWHAVVDALRRELATYWRTLPLAERQRILRHLRSPWDVHRFRMAPQVANLMDRGRREGWLHFSAGRVDGIERIKSRFVLRWTPRGGEPLAEEADAIVNCTGPDSDIRRSPRAVVRNLLDRGSIRADGLRIGFDVNAEGRLLDRGGRASARLWAAGPLARAVVGEATGVPEASQQARVVASALAAAIAKDHRSHTGEEERRDTLHQGS